MSSQPVPQPEPPEPPPPPGTPVSDDLLREIEDFCAGCLKGYTFNSRWDNVLILTSLALSLGVVASSFVPPPEGKVVTAMLGAFTTAIITAQRAFPVHQRWQFYRTLLSQVENLKTRARAQTINTEQAIQTLSALRLDYAQQIPRGTIGAADAPEPPPAPAAPKKL